MLGHIYLTYITPYTAPWYFPPCTFLGIFVLAHLIDQGIHSTVHWNRYVHSKIAALPASLVRIAAQLTLVVALLLSLCAAYQLAIHQEIIEKGNRKQVGLWLRKNADSPDDTVFLEPLGYIGFFSRLRMLDFPGLASPKVVETRRRLQTDDWSKLIPALNTDWLVLRSGEAKAIHLANEKLFSKTYSLVKIFDVTERVRAYRWIPGRGYLHGDQKFLVFKRNRSISRNDN
jgi:hypothetical protein